MLGRLVAGAGAGSEPASEPEPLPAAGRAAPEHCCRGGRSSGYWVGARPFFFFFNGVSFVRIFAIGAKNLLRNELDVALADVHKPRLRRNLTR